MAAKQSPSSPSSLSPASPHRGSILAHLPSTDSLDLPRADSRKAVFDGQGEDRQRVTFKPVALRSAPKALQSVLAGKFANSPRARLGARGRLAGRGRRPVTSGAIRAPTSEQSAGDVEQGRHEELESMQSQLLPGIPDSSRPSATHAPPATAAVEPPAAAVEPPAANDADPVAAAATPPAAPTNAPDASGVGAAAVAGEVSASTPSSAPDIASSSADPSA